MQIMMLSWIKTYHAYLCAKGAETPPLSRYMGIQSIAMPWWLPLIGVLAWCICFNPPDGLRVLVTCIVGIPTVGGMIYAMLVYGISGIRQDMRNTAGK